MIGQTIGNFHVVAQLGSGGMGDVFVGEQVNIQTRVAIKVLHREISADKQHVERFFNEARIVSRIKHAGVVKIFDVGFHGPNAYLVMELLEGESLAGRIQRQGKFSLAQIADICRQIASTLAATHAAGVIHRDLKPDNVMLTADHELGHRERVKLLDFGIAKLSGTLASGSPRTVGTMGTPAYMAPEQWGNSANVDWRADAYSLGCLAFEMACGKTPFDTTTIADACAKHLHAVPPRVRMLSPDLPPALDQLIDRLLAKDPNARGASMEEIARAFAACDTQPHVRAHDAATIAVNPNAHAPRPAAHTTLGGSAGERVVEPRKAKWPTYAALAVVAVAAIASVSVLAGRSSDDEADTRPAASPAAAATPAPAPAPAPTPAAAHAPTPAAAPAPTPAAVEPTTAATKPSASTPATKPAAPKPATKKQPTASAKSSTGAKPPASCDPPYTLDANGKRIYKQECL